MMPRYNWETIMLELQLSFRAKDIEQIKRINELIFQFMEVRRLMNK